MIGSGQYQLESNYGNIFKCGIGDWSNEGSKELILSAVYGNGTDNYRYGNRVVALFAGKYVDAKWGNQIIPGKMRPNLRQDTIITMTGDLMSIQIKSMIVDSEFIPSGIHYSFEWWNF